MAAIIFDNDHLHSSLLPDPATSGAAGERKPGGGGGRRDEEQPTGLESSSTSSLNSSRKTLNAGSGGGELHNRERMFSEGGVVVELSNHNPSGRKMEKSQSHYSYRDSVDGSDEDDDEEDSDNDDDQFLRSRVSQQQLIVNDDALSYGNSTLPRLFNPGMHTGTVYP